MTEIINRTATIDPANIDLTKRTLEGVAYAFDKPERVSDNGRDFYLEEFASTSADRSLKLRPRFPLGILHPWSPGARTSPIPIGAVEFSRSAEGIVFAARVSKTVAGDEALELLHDEALGDVSISARNVRSTRRMSPAGLVTVRQEIGLRELSLAPPGMGARPESKVLVMRTESVDEGTPRLDAVRRRLLLL